MMLYGSFHTFRDISTSILRKCQAHSIAEVPVKTPDKVLFLFSLYFNIYQTKQIYRKHLPMQTLIVSMSCKICLFLLFKKGGQ